MFHKLRIIACATLGLGSASLDQQNVAILNHVILALGHDLALCLDLRFVAELLEHVVVEHNGLDERLLKVSVDDTRCLRRLGAVADRPLPDLVGADSEEAAQVEGLAHLEDDLAQRRLGSDILALLLDLGFGLEPGQALLEADGDGNDGVAGSMLLDPLNDLGKMLVLLPDVVPLGKVDQEDNRLGGQEEKRVDDLNLNNGSASMSPI
jgi:hypothetical protein